MRLFVGLARCTTEVLLRGVASIDWEPTPEASPCDDAIANERTERVDFFGDRVGPKPVSHGFVDQAVHVVEPKCIGLELAHFLQTSL